MLLGVRPLAARGGQAAEGEAWPRPRRRLPSPLAARLGLERGGLGAGVREQAPRLGEQAERPRRHGGVASLDQRHQALEPVASLLGPAGGELGKGERDQQVWHGIAGAELQGAFEPPRQALERALGLALPGIDEPLIGVRKCLKDRLPGVRHRRSQPLDRLARLGEATVELSRHSDPHPAPGDLEGVAQPLGQRGDLLVGAGGLRVFALEQVGESRRLLGQHERPVVARRPGELGRARELRSRRAAGP